MSALSMRPRRDWLIPMVSLTLVFLAAARAPIDSDLWWHLAAGRWTWANGQPLLMDVFSFTRSGVSWINHSWLSQWLLFVIYSLGGQLALGGLVASLATLCMGLVYAQMRGPAIYRAFLVVLACMVTAVVWTARPQMFSLALFGFLSWILFLFKWRKRNYLWTLPPLFWLWSNLHGGWSLGLMLLGCFGAGELLNHVLRSPAPEVVAWSDLKKLAAWGALAIFVLPINPNGISILKIPFDTVGVQALQQTIQEWASPDFHDLTQQPMLWLLIGLTLVFGLGGRKVDGGDLLTVAWFGALALLARRNYGPFGLAVVPILSRYLWAWISSWKQSEVHIGTQWVHLYVEDLRIWLGVVKAQALLLPLLLCGGRCFRTRQACARSPVVTAQATRRSERYPRWACPPLFCRGV